ncbi:alpha/beta fold hydrolase [Rhizobium miluonense]|uniref:Alpha/beta hydrolase family protein n=1 Tax=Rhizobium miluonense TaxID=411945 RepID=A0A1C3WE38_9HYPH|nr:alpha/beta fold hydrolase [Rhizobium miluonense]SCB37964.1 Alpha/beta hydrolase family protein [Rhizobium miluonense]
MAFWISKMTSFSIGSVVETVSGQRVHELKLQQQETPFIADTNGDFDMGHIYVQEFRLQQPTTPIPLLLWHGGGLTGSVWEQNADGAPGWMTRSLERGHDVFCCDAVGMGRSSWAHLPSLYNKQPIFRSKGEAWSLFRIGTPQSYSSRRAFTGSQFPVENFDSFTRLIVPRWTDMDEMNINAYNQLVKRVGPCAIVAHSSAALYAYEALRRWPNLVRAICLVEPGFAPPWEIGMANNLLRDTPVLQIFADNIAGHDHWETHWRRARAGFDNFPRHPQSRWLDLPEEDIFGNTHCPMSDSNSDQILDIVLDWLESLPQ